MRARGRVTSSFFLLPVVVSLGTIGCRNCDLVEAELRTRENELREIRADLVRTEAFNEGLLRELAALRQGSATKMPPELASQTYMLKQITLGRGTGGIDEDNCPGDDALQVVLEPRDGDGHTIKAPGSVHIEAYEINPEGLKVPLSAWDLNPEQVRHAWHGGLFSNGYIFVLPWKQWPTQEKIRVVGRFTLADGRLFEADKDVTVRLVPPAQRRPLPPVVPPDSHALPESIPTLPPPRPLETTPTAQSKAWWLVPSAAAPADLGKATTVQSAFVWRPKAEASAAESVELLRPTALKYQPGEEP